MTTYKNQPHEVMQGIFFYLIINGDFMLKRRKFRISSSFLLDDSNNLCVWLANDFEISKKDLIINPDNMMVPFDTSIVC
jgi:hypothetical protein